jgi:hypothetical protein
MTLSLDEVLRRFLLHLLPKGFVRIRHFGFLAIGGALPYCHYASLHWAQFHRRPGQKLPPLRNRNLFGAGADRWRSSNDSPLLNSNSVLHHCRSLLPHEIARPQHANSARFAALRTRPLGS